MYLDRIEAYGKRGPKLNAIIMVNPNALAPAMHSIRASPNRASAARFTVFR
jgi:hypothetical protein